MVRIIANGRVQPDPVYRRVMIFIDGGYLREEFKNLYGHDNIDFQKLFYLLEDSAYEGSRYPEIIRAYYYDGRCRPEDDMKMYEAHNKYFAEIEEFSKYEVKLVRLKKTPRGQRQKGADVRLAVDMLTKAFMNHYDFAILLSGDDDFLDLVKQIKELTDKRIFGAYFEGHISEELRISYDKQIVIKKQLLDRVIKT